MDKNNSNSGNGISIKIIFLILIGLWVVWYFGGGPDRLETREGPFIRPLSPLGTGEIYRDHNLLPESGQNQNRLSSTRIRMNRVYNAGANDPEQEYVVLNYISGDQELDITGWSLSGDNRQVTIGTMATVARLGQVNPQARTLVQPGDTIIINSGRSPIGTSFRENICTGYLEQFQDITPTVRRSCPNPLNTAPASISNQTECLDFINQIPQCQINLQPIPNHLSTECQDFIANDLSYNSCVDTHSQDQNFATGIIRIYLGSNTSLWQANEEVVLQNASGEVIDQVIAR